MRCSRLTRKTDGAAATCACVLFVDAGFVEWVVEISRSTA